MKFIKKINNKIVFPKNKNSGQAMLISVLYFVFISLSVVSGIVSPSVREYKTTSVDLNSKKSYFLAESGVEDAVYRIKNNKSIGASEVITLDNSIVTTTITDINNGLKQISALGDISSFQRKINLDVSTSDGVSFNYGVQVGRGGIVFSNNSRIVGNVYANGSLTGSGDITGTAIAANSPSLVADQINDAPSVPTHSINFRNSASSVDFAQSFQVLASSPVNKIQFYLKKIGSPSNATIRIVADNSGSPSTTNLLSTQGTLSASSVTTSYGWVDVFFADNPTLFSNTTYWVIIDNTSNSNSNYYTIGANDNIYSSGSPKVGVYAGTWNGMSPSTLDSYFKIYLGGLTSQINGINVGSGGVGDAWANTISGGSVAGIKYCKIGTGCNTTRPDPSPTSFPVSDSNIQEWKDAALAGGIITGNYTASGSQSLGPKKITGNLIVDNGADLTLTGALWVVGNITVSNNSRVRLSSSYGSNDGVMIADGRILISNNGVFSGSGVVGSYVMALTTSKCPDDINCSGASAINVGNNARAVILNAQKGTIDLSNNSSLIQATAETLTLGNNAVVIYQSGIADSNFSSGPSGSWSVSNWAESE